MAKKTQISNLTAAKANKKDEFYTQLSDIEKYPIGQPPLAHKYNHR